MSVYYKGDSPPLLHSLYYKPTGWGWGWTLEWCFLINQLAHSDLFVSVDRQLGDKNTSVCVGGVLLEFG